MMTLPPDNPITECMMKLLAAVIESDAKGLAVAKNMVAASAILSRRLSAENRFVISEMLRSLADELEQPVVNIERIRIKV
jgi:hypothetical protein